MGKQNKREVNIRKPAGNLNALYRAGFLFRIANLLTLDRFNLTVNDVPLSRYYSQTARKICLRTQIRLWVI